MALTAKEEGQKSKTIYLASLLHYHEQDNHSPILITDTTSLTPLSISASKWHIVSYIILALAGIVLGAALVPSLIVLPFALPIMFSPESPFFVSNLIAVIVGVIGIIFWLRVRNVYTVAMDDEFIYFSKLGPDRFNFHKGDAFHLRTVRNTFVNRPMVEIQVLNNVEHLEKYHFILKEGLSEQELLEHLQVYNIDLRWE